MAVTHTELYRSFEGSLRPLALRFLPIFSSGLRVATRKKLPLLLLFTAPTITGIVFSFLVYTRFSVQMTSSSAGLDPRRIIASVMAEQMAQVHEQIVQAGTISRAFALLVVAWFGAGLIAEDRRLGAHLLYFSRPLTRIDYFLGHFCTTAFFCACAVLGPGLLICIVAIFSSENFAFLKQQPGVILATVGYGLLYSASLSVFVLAISSITKRKAIALATIFGLLVFNEAVAVVMFQLTGDADFLMLAVWANFERLGYWMLGAEHRLFRWNPSWSVLIVAGFTLVCAAVCALRIRRLEVVA